MSELTDMSISCEITDRKRGLLRPRCLPLLSPISPADVKLIRSIDDTSYQKSKNWDRFVPIDPTEGECIPTTVEKKISVLGFPSQTEATVKDGGITGIMQFDAISDTAEKPNEKGEVVGKNDSERGTDLVESSEILVKLDAFKPLPMSSSWKNVHVDHSTQEIDGQFDDQFKRLPQQVNGNPNFSNFLNMNGKPFITILPKPIDVNSQVIDLNQSIPGIIQQPCVIVEGTIGFPVAKIVAPFHPLIEEIDSTIINALKEFNDDRSTLQKILQKQSTTQEALPTLEDIPCIVQSLYKLLEIGLKRSENDENQQGVRTHAGDVQLYVLGQFVKIDKNEIFVPGYVIESCNGPTFVPGLVVRTDQGRKFIPGFILKDEFDLPVFVAGQNTQTENGEKFILGQFLQTNQGARFIPGQTVITPQGIKFAPGQIVPILEENIENKHRFVSGLSEGGHFITGQFCQNLSTNEVSFIPGQSILNEKGNWEFIPGQNIQTEDGSDLFIPGTSTSDQREQSACLANTTSQKVFAMIGGKEKKANKGAESVPGRVLQTKSGLQFVPGRTVRTENREKFIPGRTFETKFGPTFIPGEEFVFNEQTPLFVPGQVVNTIEGLRFVPGRILHANGNILLQPSEVIEIGGDLKFVPANLKDHPGSGYQFKLQGLKITSVDEEKSSCSRFLHKVDIDCKPVSGEFLGGNFVSSKEGRKCDDTTTTKLDPEKTISKILDRLGVGLCSPVAYDTAWVARVPQAENLELPAFPLSLQWLRDNQLEDGTWGSILPFHAYSSTLNTLAAIVALAQWDYPEDRDRIKRGAKALWHLVERLSSETHETIGFEVLLPALISEASKYNLDIPCQHYKIYEEKGRKKLDLILLGFRKYGSSKPATWWHNLEALGDSLEINLDDESIGFFPSMLVNGSIGASPSSTAHVLRSQRLKGVDIPEAAEYLKKIYSLYGGGISQVFPIDIFELAFSMDYFLKAGFSPKHNSFIEAVKRLSERCNSRGMIGFSSYFKVPDSDDMAVALHVLHSAGYEISPEHLLPFCNGTHISTFINEMNFSLSANVNVLRTLRLFQGMEKVDEVIGKIVTCLESQAASAEQVFVDDKWHNSPYYSSSRAVFALHGLRNDIVKRCLDFFVKSQNPDGGWGKNGFSTAEESAYVVLALCSSLKNGYSISRYVLEKAYEYLSNPKTEFSASLWIGKVLYRPTLVAESAIIAAQYSLAQAFEQMEAKNILEESELDYVEFNLKIDAQNSFRGVILCPSLEFDVDKYSDQISRVQTYVVNRLIEIELIKTGGGIKESSILKDTLYTLGCESSDEDLILYSTASIAILIYDDILDKPCQLFRNNPIIVKHTFQNFLEILQGKYKNIDMIPPTDFPKFVPLCKLFFDLRLGITRKQYDIEQFLIKTKKVFDSLIEEAFNRSNNIVMISPQSYLESSKLTFHTYFMVYLALIIKDVKLSSFEDYYVFQEFEDCGLKAASLIADIISVSRDLDEKSQFDNYVLVKQAESNCCLEDAFTFSIELYNKLVIKMNHLKKKMQNHPNYKDDRELFKAVAVYENFVQGLLDWSLKTTRYHSKSTVSFSKKKLTSLDFPLVTSFFTV